ncbi:MAG: phospho-sugar mutase, partial [Actinomycetota bacterium]
MSLPPELRAEAERWAAIDAEHGDEIRRLLAAADAAQAETDAAAQAETDDAARPAADDAARPATDDPARASAASNAARAETDAVGGHDPAGAAAELGRLFGSRVAFGTAGLRAAMGPGPARMNRLVVRQTTAGLLDWLGAEPTVVIGYDARHHSRRFAHDVAAVVLDRGGRALVVDRPAPTPVLALAVLDQRADAGIVITASHNPAADNGYKLYLGDGIQLVPPADSEIAAAIDRLATVDPLPGIAGAGEDDPLPSGAEDIAEAALARHREVAMAALLTEHRAVHVLYTAMHGVGGAHLLDCFEAAGFPAPAVVAEQFEPDPEFPTASFPNPEEPGALDLALAAAEASIDTESPVDVVIANDPDADRLAVAVPDRNGRWSRLTGDEVGALLADHVLRHRPSAAESGGRAVLASSIVSSRFIDRLAEGGDADSVRTLTGFKWVARPIVDRPGDPYLLGYEEALGYCVGDRVRDKDGISAALVLAELAADCRRKGRTLRDRLDELAVANGLYATAQVTVRLDDLDADERERLMTAAVGVDPVELAGVAVVGREDLAEGRLLPPTAGIVLDLADGARVIVRPSGTEPKVKAYLEVVVDDVPAGGIGATRAAADGRL